MARVFLVAVALAVALSAVSASVLPRCLPDWNNQCHSNAECCSGNCDNNNGAWADGVCQPGNGGGDGGDGGNINISFDQFSRAVTDNFYPAPSRAQYDAFIAGLGNGRITTQREAAMALAQYLHESDGLQAKREYRCQNDQCPNDYRTPGCDRPGQYYYGRGYIQLTWCYNYQSAQQDLGLGNKLVEDADSVAREEQLAWNTAFSYWKRSVHDAAGVQQGKFGAATNAINGALECNGAGSGTPAIRFQRYQKIYSIFGLSGSPDASGC